MASEEMVRFTLRLPPELYELVKESAEKNKRSIVREIEYIVEKSFSQKDLSIGSEHTP